MSPGSVWDALLRALRRWGGQARHDGQPLLALDYTVFDTETTGLHPQRGDEIIAIGALRIRAGQLLGEAPFEQLVDPRRALSPQSIAVHGTRPEMLRGQPPIEEVLPRFHAFAEGTVLVAHHAPFDLRFLQRKERQAGVRFANPVLDTRLLSLVVYPRSREHTLDALAARLGVRIEGRHTALGDARATAEVFLRLVDLLERDGIRTLGEARHACHRVAHTRLHH